MHYQQTILILQQLQETMEELSLWEAQSPPASALRSSEPFAVDTLEFHQWLQFIMIPRIKELIRKRQPLPANIAVSPMASQVYKDSLYQHGELIRILQKLDILLSGRDPLSETRC